MLAAQLLLRTPVALLMCGRLYLANAGDSRAVLYRAATDFAPEPLSYDFTPESDRRRIQAVTPAQSCIENQFCLRGKVLS